MKTLCVYLIVVGIFVAVFGLALSTTQHQIRRDSPTLASVLEFVGPSIAYADSDTLYGRRPPPPPPPMDIGAD